MELTTALPWTHFSPASITLHLDESMTTGTLAMSGSTAIRLRKRVMAASPSNMPSSKLTSTNWAPFSTCWAAMRTPAS